MKFMLAILCVLTSVTSASAQYGVSNARDGNGNLIRNTGMNSTRSFDQAPVNNLNNSQLQPSLGPLQKPKVNGANATK
jgi:hypothetical protein